MAADDTETDREAHAGAGLAFGREEGVEKTLFDFGRHAGASVGDADHDAFAGFLG